MRSKDPARGEEQAKRSEDAAAPGGDLAFVMSGGGARAAYQVGVLRSLARRFPRLEAPIITGVSAGAINAAHFAAHHGTFEQAAEELHHLWSELSTEKVFRTDPWSLARHVARWGRQLVSGGGKRPPRAVGLLDTDPLRAYLVEALHAVRGELTGINYNLRTGRLKAVALSTTNYSTGQSVTWTQGHDIEEWQKPNRRSRVTTLSVDHVMASAALPLVFPAVRLGAHWFGDGGIRLTAPLAPALHLGASRILAVSTRRERTASEADAPTVTGYPPPAQVAGILLNSVFLDVLDQDGHLLDRINALVAQLPPERRLGLRVVKLVTIRPSVDLGRLASRYEPDLPKGLRFMTRGLGTRQTEAPDFLSMIMFQPDYVAELIRVGEADAEARHEELAALVGPPPAPAEEGAGSR